MRKILIIGLAGAVGFVLVQSLPDIRRYLRIRAM
ncbi:DUF6893 family small protein [Kitasatospora sp. NPDC057223]|jgi:hypothetical protein